MRVIIDTPAGPKVANLAQAIDLSIAITDRPDQLNAYHAHPVRIAPFRMGNWVGEVRQGASVNYRDIYFNPHGHGTHTEGVGHITEACESVNSLIHQFHFIARLLSVCPINMGDHGHVIMPQCLPELPKHEAQAYIIRTLPNSEQKRVAHYSGADPAYFHHDTIQKLLDAGMQHIVVDLPSLDREVDGGALLCHRLFWNIAGKVASQRTITELAYVPNEVEDGLYLLNLQVAAFANDAAPSRPVIYSLEPL